MIQIETPMLRRKAKQSLTEPAEIADQANLSATAFVFVTRAC